MVLSYDYKDLIWNIKADRKTVHWKIWTRANIFSCPQYIKTESQMKYFLSMAKDIFLFFLTQQLDFINII